MSYVFRLGFRNVFRQKLRSTLAMAGIALSVALVIVGTSLMSGVETMVLGEALGEAGEIVIARQDYFDKSRFNPLKYSVKESSALRDRLLEIDGVEAALERIDFGFLAEHDGKTSPLGCSAVDLTSYARFSSLPERLVAGRFLEVGEKGILIGRSAAEELGVEPGESITVIGRTVYESFMADDFEVVGIFDLGTKLQNRRSILPLEQAQEFLEMDDAVSKILLFGESYRATRELARRVSAQDLLPEGVALRSWTDDPFFGSMYTLFRWAGLIISGIICFVAGLGIFNMLMVSVLERRREVGVLMALGTPRRGILASFFWESVVYGVAGGVMGVVLGSPMALYLDRVGLDFRIDDIQGLNLPITSTIHGDFGPQSALLGLAIGILLSVLGMAGPVLKTFSMGPQDAMSR